MTTPPPEPNGGQDDPPDVRTAVHAVLGFLHDLAERQLDDDIRRRLVALRNALQRLRDHLAEQQP